MNIVKYCFEFLMIKKSNVLSLRDKLKLMFDNYYQAFVPMGQTPCERLNS
jgi:hypothetical protein